MLSSLRSEIKSWERQFRLNNGRDPQIQDIKLQPPIGILQSLISIHCFTQNIQHSRQIQALQEAIQGRSCCRHTAHSKSPSIHPSSTNHASISTSIKTTRRRITPTSLLVQPVLPGEE